MDATTAYKLEEVKFLRSEFELRLRQVSDNERNTVIAFALVVSFIASINIDNATHRAIMSVVPLLIAISGALRALVFRKVLLTIDDYMHTVENSINSECVFWHSYLDKVQKRKAFPYAASVFWVLLIAAGVAFALVDLSIRKHGFR